MTYTWRFYLLVAHLVDEKNHTACNRQLKQSDEIIDGSLYEHLKCKTCLKFIVKEQGKE